MELPLREPVTAEWQADYDRLMHDPYIRKKYNRARRIAAKIDYVRDMVPEVKTGNGVVLDIGPGPGEFLEVCRAYGNKVGGIDAKIDDCEMGDEYIRLSKLMTARQGIQVWYNGFENRVIPMPDNSVSLINSQGSIEQVMKKHLVGPPHKQTKKASLLEWTGDDWMRLDFENMFIEYDRVLKRGGIVCIWANGAKNTRVYTELVDRLARKQDWDLVKAKGDRFRKWVKL